MIYIFYNCFSFKSMQIQQFIPYFRQSISRFVNLSNSVNSQENIDIASKNVIELSKHEMFLQVAFHVLTSNAKTNSSFENILISNLIKDKFKYEFETISEDNLQAYYSALISMFQIQIQSSSAFFNNIELSLAYIYISTVSQVETSLETYLNSIIDEHELAQSPKANYYLKVLGYIPSEIQDNRLVIDQKSRQKAKQFLIENQKNILIFLNNVSPMLWDNNNIQRQKIIQTFSDWVSLTYDEVVYQSLPYHFLTNKMFQLLEDDTALQTAKLCIESIVNSSYNLNQNHDLVNLFLDKNRKYLVLEAQKLISKQQYDLAQQYVNVIIIISKRLCKKYLHEIQQFFMFMKTLAELSFFKELDLENRTLNFWQQFFDEVYRQMNSNNSCELQKLQHLALFCFERVVRKCQFSNFQIEKLQTQEQSTIKKCKDRLDTRRKCQHLFESISRVLTINIYVEYISTRINQLVHRQRLNWPKIQALYFALIIEPIQQFLSSQSTQNIDPITLINKYFYQLVQRQNVPNHYEHGYYVPIAVKRVFMKFLRYSAKIQNLNTNIVIAAIQYSCMNFSSDLLCQQAQKTFEKICEFKSQTLEKNIEESISLIEHYQLKNNIVGGVLNLICRKSKNVELYLYETFKKIYYKVLDANQEKKQNKKVLCLISACKVVFQNKDKIIEIHYEIIKKIYQMLWPFLQDSLTHAKFVQDDEDCGVQRTVKIVKFLMRCLNSRFSQFLPQLIQSVKVGYSKFPICSYLYVFEVAVPIFSNHPAYQDLLLEFYKYLCNKTIVYFKEKYMDIQNYTLLVQDFIGMNKKFFMLNALMVSRGQMFEQILNICYYFVFHTNMRISRAAYSYFQTIFMVYWRKQFLVQHNQAIKDSTNAFKIQNQYSIFYEKFKQCLVPIILNLLTRAFDHLRQVPVQSTRQYILDCILSEIKAFPQQNMQIWSQFLNTLPCQILLLNQKQQFLVKMSYLNDQNIKLAEASISLIKKKLYLISKRYVYAFKRSNLKPFPSSNKQ